MSVLSSVFVPHPSTSSEDILRDILAGAIFGTAMLHNAGKKPIAPVTFMWQPLHNMEVHNVDSVDKEQNNGDCSAIRQLWVWIHAVLLSSCERQTDTTRPVKCVSREGQLAKLELIGSKVFELLQKILQPASSSENSWLLKKLVAENHDDQGVTVKASILENENQISSSGVVSLVVEDPRISTKKENVITPQGKSLGLLSNKESQLKECTFSSLLKREECVVEYRDWWDVSKGVCPPVEESVLCMEKHQQWKELFRIGNKSSGSQNASADGKYSRVCPVMLVKNENHEDSVTRCSIILPLSWVKAFWLTLMSNGAHAIGIREKHWIACEIGFPYFPMDFPDCNAYSRVMEIEANEINHKSSLRPPSKRPVQVPIPPPWDCGRLNFDEAENSQEEKNDTSIPDCHDDASFDGIIARTSSMLSDFLNNINSNHLLLFPKLLDSKSCMYEFMKNKDFSKENTVISETKRSSTRCYVRVLLRAYKEGVLEQGAVICAPHLTDIMSLKDRSESDEQQVQIPQSLLKSYFIQSPSGKWELQVPEDPVLRESHKWPIGFITTGFVRGSKKAMAGALCEASLLSELRMEQWKALPVRQRKEIYVLVRNLRSTAYRLALATIVLEQQEQDIAFF